MYYIDNYTEEAINKLIPYLIEFPEIVTLTENSANRYQAIEDVLWKIATNFKLVDSRGVFLDAHAHNEVVDLVYTDKARDAFTYGATWSEAEWEQENYNPRVFGTGKFYSQASYLSGVPKDVSEEKLIRAVQEKIIQNNTTGVIEDFIEAMKLHFNATQVEIFESYPLSISLVLSGENLELSSSGDKDAIKKCLPACVSLKDFYINDHKYDRFIYSDKSRYGYDSRYPILIGDTDYIYQYVSNAINLNSTNEEYIEIKNSFNSANFQDNIPFECIIGKITELNDGATLYSFTYTLNNTLNSISLKLKGSDENYYFKIIKSSIENNQISEIEVVDTGIKAELNREYTLLMTINNLPYDSLRLWIFNSVKLIGQSSNQDVSWAYNIIQNDNTYSEIFLNSQQQPYEPEYSQNILINANIIANNVADNFADFTYYAIVGGEIGTNSNIILDDKAHYYITCFGEKNILFNCLQNKNHVLINTNDTLETDLLVKQGSFNYKKWHSNGRYLNVYNPDSENAGIQWGEENGVWSEPIQIVRGDTYSLGKISFFKDRFICVGEHDYIFSSINAINWNREVQFNDTSLIWYDIANSDNMVIVVGTNYRSHGTITTYTEQDGWSTPVDVGTYPWHGIAYGDGKFIAVGTSGYVSIYTEQDGWSTPVQVGTNNWHGIAYNGNGKFIAVGNGGYTATYTEQDGWSTPVQVGTYPWYSIEYGDGKFIAVGNNGRTAIYTEQDGWFAPVQVGTNNFYDIAYGDGKFIAVGRNCYYTTYTEQDGWSTPVQTTTQPSTLGWNGIAYNNRKFVIVGFTSNTSYFIPLKDVLINSFELSMDICRLINIDGNIINGLIGQTNKLSINSNGTINLPVYTSGNVETLYTITIPTTAQNLIQNKFGNLKIKYDDNIVYIYLNNELVKSENIPNISVRYLNTKLELGPTNAFIKNFKFSCNYTENLTVENLEYSIPLIKDIYEENKLIQPNNINARFLTVPQLIDNKENKDLYGNPVIREVN